MEGQSTLLLVLDLVGIFVFAISGALVGVRKNIDIFGVLVLAGTTALAGGFLRDVLSDATPPAALTDWRAATWLLERFDPDQFARRDRASCSPKDLQSLVDRVIETVLKEVDKDEDRTRIYRAATAVASRGFNLLFPASRRDEQRLARGPMPLREWEELVELLDRSAPTELDVIAGRDFEPLGRHVERRMNPCGRS